MTNTVYGMRILINGAWVKSVRFWADQERAEAFIARMNRAGLQAEPINGKGACTYVEGAVFTSHPEPKDQNDAITAAIIATM